MSDIRDYVRWRGDLSFRSDPPNPADALVFAALSYLRLEGLAPKTPVGLPELARKFLELKDCEDRLRSKTDPELLALAADSQRFGSCKAACYEDIFLPEEDTQFAAVTFLGEDGSVFMAFRGTDSTVVGWKEDFNMSFQQTVPSQRLAQDYVRRVSREFPGDLWLCGHSKGGNLAVFAAARSAPWIQQRIRGVCNLDGPGFSQYLMGDPGYLRMVPKIHTFVPQSSVIGMLMDHEEPYTIIKSRQISILQHDIYNWEILGPGFLPMEEITADSRFLNETIRNWAATLSNHQRNLVVDAMFGLLEQVKVEDASDILDMKNLYHYIRILSADEEMRAILGGEFAGLIEAAAKTFREIRSQKDPEKPSLPRPGLLDRFKKQEEKPGVLPRIPEKL